MFNSAFVQDASTAAVDDTSDRLSDRHRLMQVVGLVCERQHCMVV